MKKTFRFLAVAFLISSITLIGCREEDPIENTNEQTPSISYAFENMENWNPQSVFAGYESSLDTMASFIVTRNYYPGLEEYYADCNYGYETPENALLVSIPYKVGNHTRNSNFVTDENADDVTAIFTTSGVTDYEGTPIPNAWISEAMNISVSEADMTTKKISATITATMRDYLYLFSYGECGNPESKTLTITIKNYPLENWNGIFSKQLSKN